MMLDMWDEMRALERRLDDLFRTFLGARSWVTFPALPAGLRRPFIPSTDVFVRDGDLVVKAELPGIDPDKDVEVTLAKGELIIRGERKRTEEVKEKDFYRAEASYGAFDRHVPVPEGTKEADIKADYRDGVLEVMVRGAAAVEAPTGKSIPVRTEKRKKVKAA
ncbi:MAG: Hsp20/alpha crystallin family protein [Actinomycetota bacterium]